MTNLKLEGDQRSAAFEMVLNDCHRGARDTVCLAIAAFGLDALILEDSPDDRDAEVG